MGAFLSSRKKTRLEKDRLEQELFKQKEEETKQRLILLKNRRWNEENERERAKQQELQEAEAIIALRAMWR